MPWLDTVFKSFAFFSSSILDDNLVKLLYYPNLIDKEIEAQTSEIFHARSHDLSIRRSDLNSVLTGALRDYEACPASLLAGSQCPSMDWCVTGWHLLLTL